MPLDFDNCVIDKVRLLNVRRKEEESKEDIATSLRTTGSAQFQFQSLQKQDKTRQAMIEKLRLRNKIKCA